MADRHSTRIRKVPAALQPRPRVMAGNLWVDESDEGNVAFVYGEDGLAAITLHEVFMEIPTS